MSLMDLAEKINRTSSDNGFWPEQGRNFGEMIALAHSELSEALEAHRDGLPAMTPAAEGEKPEGVAVELADCIIRCLDTMWSLGVDIDEVVLRKMAYNETRSFKHGKAY